MESQRQTQTGRSFKRRVYDTLRTTSAVETQPRVVRITQLQPAIDLSLVWGQSSNVISPDGARSAWYMMIHDIIPTNMRLRRIPVMDMDKCTQCRRQDTKLNLLTECGVKHEILEWTRPRIARVQRTDPRRISKEWLLRPCFKLWPRQIHQATLRCLASMGYYVVNQCRNLSVLDCIDCLRRKRWKIQGDSGGICNTLGNDSMCDPKQKCSYEHGSDLERLPRYGKKKIRTITCMQVLTIVLLMHVMLVVMLLIT